MPRVVDLVGDRNIPVIAAGGIVNARGYVAALALGAKGVCLGTRYEEPSSHILKTLQFTVFHVRYYLYSLKTKIICTGLLRLRKAMLIPHTKGS